LRKGENEPFRDRVQTRQARRGLRTSRIGQAKVHCLLARPPLELDCDELGQIRSLHDVIALVTGASSGIGGHRAAPRA